MTEEDVVWWSRTGSVLHRDPDCPPFLRARARAISRVQKGDFEAADLIHSYDFRESNLVADPYPPEAFGLCRLCRDKGGSE